MLSLGNIFGRFHMLLDFALVAFYFFLPIHALGALFTVVESRLAGMSLA